MIFEIDHDKEWDFNWKATADQHTLHWDSGLGWRHGPLGLPSCLEILCGTANWRDVHSPHQDSSDIPCEPIRVFRKKTIQFLRNHSHGKEKDSSAGVISRNLKWMGRGKSIE